MSNLFYRNKRNIKFVEDTVVDFETKINEDVHINKDIYLTEDEKVDYDFEIENKRLLTEFIKKLNGFDDVVVFFRELRNIEPNPNKKVVSLVHRMKEIKEYVERNISDKDIYDCFIGLKKNFILTSNINELIEIERLKKKHHHDNGKVYSGVTLSNLINGLEFNAMITESYYRKIVNSFFNYKKPTTTINFV